MTPIFFIALLKYSKHDHQLDQVLENFKFSFYFDGITFFNGFKPKRRLYGCLPFAKTFRKIRLECKWYMTFRVVPVENFREQLGTSEKVVLFFRTECSKRKFVFHLFNPHLSGSRAHFLTQHNDGKENVTFEMISQSFKLLSDYSDSFNLSNVVELSRS